MQRTVFSKIDERSEGRHLSNADHLSATIREIRDSSNQRNNRMSWYCLFHSAQEGREWTLGEGKGGQSEKQLETVLDASAIP